MRSRQPFCGTAFLFVLVIFPLLYLDARAADDDDEEEDKAPPLPKESAELVRQFLRVPEWKGFFECSETGAVTWSGFYSHGSQAIANTSHGQFVIKRSLSPSGDDPKRGVLTWSGGNNSTVCGEQIVSHDKQWSVWDKQGRGEEGRLQSVGTLLMSATEFTIWLPTAKANRFLVHMHAGGNLSRKTINTIRTGRWVSFVNKGDGTEVQRTGSLDETTQSNSFVHWYAPVGDAAKAPWVQVVRGGPGVLVFPFESVTRADTQASTPEITRRSRVMLYPVYDDVEVEVTIEGYAKWRPLGSIDEPKEPGNGLVAHAVLKSKSGKIKDLPEVERFRFELTETSREPGVCLNWPLEAKDDDYDLKFADFSAGGSAEQLAAARKFVSDWGMQSMGDFTADSMPDGGMPAMSFGKVSANGQKAELLNPLKDKTGQPYADAAIESYDFGGRAMLQVTCVLKDGREIIGLMKAEGGQQDLVRLPKRNGPDWIAESWRKNKKVEKLPELDDNEKVDGQKDNGDGYTLYEEYRGWVEKGKHIEGDPARKDFFVLNLIGADARGGINLFEAVSKLRVHSRLRRSEMSQTERLMNGNHRDAPHRVDQHGVWVKQFATIAKLGGDGAFTPMTRSGVAGRPGITVGIGLLARNNTESLFNQSFNLPARDTIFAYDRAIAHELLHSVGVEHHGSGDGTLTLYWVSPRHPRNKVGRPYFRTVKFGADFVFTLLDENSHDIATQYMTKYAEDRLKVESRYKQKLVAEGQAYMAGHAGQTGLAWKTAAEYTEFFLEENVSDGFAFLADYVGEPQGQHSGDQDCLMRYYFARFYPAIGKEKTYYLVTPGTERIGIDICHSGKGTGVNAPKPPNLPQSRYGDAAGDAGNCFEQICPNDAIPPRRIKE